MHGVEKGKRNNIHHWGISQYLHNIKWNHALHNDVEQAGGDTTPVVGSIHRYPVHVSTNRFLRLLEHTCQYETIQLGLLLLEREGLDYQCHYFIL